VLPNVVVIGAMKGGTRSLYEYLRAHPDVFMSNPKELNFFSRDDLWAKGVGWYESHFADADAAGARARGEASTTYTNFDRSPATAERMRSVLPDVRLVYLVRHPVDRIQSHYQHLHRKGARLRPIDEEVLADDRYVKTSSYATQLAPFLDLYGAERVLVVQSEALLSQRHDTMRAIYDFVGVDPSVVPAALDAEYSRADSKRVPRSRLRGARTNPRLASVVARVPTSLRERLASVTSVASNAPEHRLSAATRATLAERLVDEVERIRPLMPPGFDAWGLA
jgi:hypothetical protein